MTESQIQLKRIVVTIFLNTFESLDDIIANLNVSKEDAAVIRESIEQDFADSCL